MIECKKCEDEGFIIHYRRGPYSPDKKYTEDCPLKCSAWQRRFGNYDAKLKASKAEPIETIQSLRAEYEALSAKADEYEAALRFYADFEAWLGTQSNPSFKEVFDSGKRARAVLAKHAKPEASSDGA